jgi:hypothetical protein
MESHIKCIILLERTHNSPKALFPSFRSSRNLFLYIHFPPDDPDIWKSNTGRFIMFSVITNIYNKKTKGPSLMELFTATGKLRKFFLTTRDIRCVHYG